MTYYYLNGLIKNTSRLYKLLLQELVFTASPDSTIRVWGVQTAQCAQIIRAHESPVTGVSLHATGDYLLSSSVDMVTYIYTLISDVFFNTLH